MSEANVSEANPSEANPSEANPSEAKGGRVRRAAAIVTTVLAALLVFLALVTPDQVSRLPAGSYLPAAFVRVPIDGVIVIAILLVLPRRVRRPAAVVLGALLGLLTVIKLIDMGFFAVLARRFDPVLDWPLFADGYRFVKDSFGLPGAIGAVILAVLLAVGLVLAITFAVMRLTALAARHRKAAAGSVAAVAAAYVAVVALSATFIPGVWVASSAAADLAYDTALKIPEDIRDRDAFATEVAQDRFRDVPGDQLLTGLRGKDVVVAFVESYGRSAIDDRGLAAEVAPVLDAGTRQLTAAGYTARSGYLTSPTAGGGSWLAHSTFLSGVWIDNEQRYRSLVSGDRFTLTRSFGRAGFRTVGFEPGVTYAWPEAEFYGYDKVYDSHTMGYRGPSFSWSTMPDQFVLEALQRAELGRAQHAPTLSEVTFTSSHTPWAPVPRMVDWDTIGDGSLYGPMVANQEKAGSVWKDHAKIRSAYARSIGYSVQSLVSWLTTYGTPDTVVVFLGDHQPAPIVTGENASRDVPVTLVAHDPAVLKRIDGWGWQDGLKPGRDAPVWRMDQFRDHFLTAFGPAGDPH
ncbi:sulfatase-like hydrolase/transferase [Mangrovihabitans endophyticus]|uniref:Sulfatase N-terminal domain-containing protein n=1 Tax=Mangrovihabitans endophyticus TaxID=1751298 RepID=A0A8J3BXH4_9ACTN|nr:sulfatase-like hydrolase/transferase [Mangrovihabitans endophyticus]GGK81081.1 hypothetical protein GCM10012284_13780 [Mangrovihabitans endophyticus]